MTICTRNKSHFKYYIVQIVWARMEKNLKNKVQIQISQKIGKKINVLMVNIIVYLRKYYVLV